MKKLRGFTLVELVIVISIIGILATVATPNMITWIQKSKFNTAQSQAKAIFNSASTIIQKYETLDRAISTNKFFDDGTSYYFGNINPPGSSVITDESHDRWDFYKKLRTFYTHLDEYKWVIEVKNHKVVHVLWSETDSDNYTGVYCACGLPEHNSLRDDMEFEKYLGNKANILAKWNDMTS